MTDEEFAAPRERVVLALSQGEAETLRAIMFRIGGDHDTTRRRHADAIDEALIEAGVVRPRPELLGQSSLNNIYFAEENLLD